MLDVVKTIVLMRPIHQQFLQAAINEKAVRTPDTEAMYDNVVKSAPNRVKNQNETMLWIIKPPANEFNSKET